MTIKKKYNICVINASLPPHYGGAEFAAFRYAERLSQDRETDVILIGHDKEGKYREAGYKHSFVIPVEVKNKEGKKNAVQQYVEYYRFFKALYPVMKSQQRRFDIVHIFNSNTVFTIIAMFIGKLLGKKVVTETSLIGTDDPGTITNMKGWKDYLKVKGWRTRFYRQADAYVSKSNVITETFEKANFPIKKVSEVPYAVDVDKYRPLDDADKYELRRRLNIWPDGKIILFAGGINKRKGVNFLLKAFIEVKAEFPDIKLLLLGPSGRYDNEFLEGLRTMIKSSGFEEDVYFPEKSVENVDEYMKAADVYVLPSFREGFPISIIEAMASRLVVVGSDIPEIGKAQISHEKDGFIFPAGDNVALANIFRKIFKDENVFKTINENARNKAVKRWSTKVVDESYRKLYKDIT